MVFPTVHSATYLHGDTTASTEYVLAWVTGVSREGRVIRYLSGTGSYKIPPVNLSLVSKDRLDVEGLKRALRERGTSRDFETLAAVKEFIRPFLK